MLDLRRKIVIGITAVFLIFCIGRMAYFHAYKTTAVEKENTEVKVEENQEAEKEEEEEEKEEDASKAAEEEAKEEVDISKISEKIDAPKHLQAFYSKEGAVISWKKVKGADGYLLYRKGKDGELKQLAQTEAVTYTDETVKEKTAYRYRVCAIVKAGEEIVSGEMTKGISYFHTEIDPDKPMVALTFDDGPSIYTKKLFKVLKKYNVRVTFFVVGERVSTYAETIKQAGKLGCEIGSHSYSHANLGTASSATINRELNHTEKRVKKALGYYTPVMRPPYGSISDKLRKKVGKPMILWSIDTLDWKTRNTASTVKAIMSHVEDGDIVLMHDLYSQSIDAAIKVIPKLMKKGYQIVTVSEMAQYKGKKLENGKAYTDMKK